MAITTKKAEALRALYAAEQQLTKHRGVLHCNCSTRSNHPTIKEIQAHADYLLTLTEIPVPQATDKQLAYIDRLLQWEGNATTREEYEEKKQQGKTLNKFQASEMISLLQSLKDEVYSRYGTFGNIQHMEEELDKLMAMI